MKRVYLVLALGFFSTSFAKADEVCKPLASMRVSVKYCDDNFDYYEAAKACKEEYVKHVNIEKIAIMKKIEAQAKLITRSEQNADFKESAKVLTTAINDLENLSDYGKKVHTEIEDYVYELILPIMDENDANADINNPQVRAEFMSRECYGDPATQMEKMQLELRPIIAQLDAAKAKAELLKSKTGHHESNLGAIDSASSIIPSNNDSTKKAESVKAKKIGSGISGNITDGKSKKIEEQKKSK